MLRLQRLAPVFATTVVFLLGFAICSFVFPNFASMRVVTNLLTDNAFLGVVAVATGRSAILLAPETLSGLNLTTSGYLGLPS